MAFAQSWGRAGRRPALRVRVVLPGERRALSSSVTPPPVTLPAAPSEAIAPPCPRPGPATGANLADESPAPQRRRRTTGRDDWLEEVYRRDYAPLVRLATLLVDREVAEEIVQDAFVRTHGRLSRLAPEKVSLYLRAAVVNGARSVLRRRQVQRRHPPLPDLPAAPAEVDGIAAAHRAEVRSALDQLAPRQREVLLLRYFLDLTELEIAATLGITAGSVKTHAHRGLAALAGRFGADR